MSQRAPVYLVDIEPQQSEIIKAVLHFIGEQGDVVEQDALLAEIDQRSPLSVVYGGDDAESFLSRFKQVPVLTLGNTEEHCELKKNHLVC